MQNDVEDAKTQEIAKLQATLQEIQLHVESTSAELSRERELNKAALGQAVLAAERVPSVEVTDAKVDKLVAENDTLKVICSHTLVGVGHPSCLLPCVRYSVAGRYAA